MAIQQTDELVKALLEAKDCGATELFMAADEPLVFRIGRELVRGTGSTLTAAHIRNIALAAVGEEALNRLGNTDAVAQTRCNIPGVIAGRLTIGRSMGDLTLTVAIRSSFTFTPEQLGLPAAMMQATEAPHGLILVTGGTGSGKATAAYALLEYINTHRAVRIGLVTPYVNGDIMSKQALIQQHEVGTDIPDAVSGIRGCLQQDCDVIGILDIDGAAVADAALLASRSGRLVIACAHGTTPEDVVQRLVDMHPADEQPAFRRALAPDLLAISTQILIPRAEGKGRMAAYALLVPDEATRAAITSGKDLAASPPPAGSCSLAQAIDNLKAEELITPEAASDARSKL